MNFRGLAVVEGFVGAIVTFGGVALAYFSGPGLGTALGIVHMSLGILAFPAAYALWVRTPWARRFALGLNALTIAWSVLAESVVALNGSLASGEFLGSVVGTLIALLLCFVVVVSVMRRPDQNGPPASEASAPVDRVG